MMILLRRSLLGLVGVLLMPMLMVAHEEVVRTRTPVAVPDIPGYRTLKCDFHIHTVFSDGLLWPTLRAEEAWREGLDAIAITDHIEYQPHKGDMVVNHNRAFDLARPSGESLDVIVIRGSEITRSMPPGHLNAIFLQDSAALEVDRWQDAVAEAHRQGAFIFWNHPGWDAQLEPDGVVRWFEEHSELLREGKLDGIEVVNGRLYYPEAFAWALEKPLAVMSNSDVHSALNLDYHVHRGDHRPLTLVFARERSEAGIREALFARRTAAYSGDRLVGEEQYVKPIFEQSVSLRESSVTLRGDRALYLQIHNASEIPYRLERRAKVEELSIPRVLVLPAGQTVLAQVKSTSKDRRGKRTLGLPYRVTNVLVAPGQPLEVDLRLAVEFVGP